MSEETSELERRHADIVARYGEWTYDIPLADGFWTRGNEGDPQTRLRRVMETIDDLVPKPLGECRVLDLACLEGQYAIECALRGASVLGIEAREASLAKANFAKDALRLGRHPGRRGPRRRRSSGQASATTRASGSRGRRC